MPNASIVITAQDRYSDVVKKMASVTKSFDKDVDNLEDTLYSLNKNKITLKMDLSRAKDELKEAEKQFQRTQSAADGLKVELAQANYDNISRNLRAVTREANSTERAISRVQNKAGSGGSYSGMMQIVSSIATAGGAQMLGALAQDAVNTVAGSSLGSSGGTLVSSALSSAITGAAIGSIVPGVGSAVGAALGGAVGAVSGAVQNFEKQDDAFKSYVQEAYEGQIAEQSESLTSGSTIAGSREQTQMAFAQRLGGDEAATDYLNQVREMAKSTNYTYDEITGYSKLLLNSYGADETLGVLMSLSDATAGLNLNSSDIQMFISGLSRMRTTGKATQEYLNYFSERGVDVYQALADATGADRSSIADMVTAGEISGGTAAQAILDYIDQTYGGLSEKLAATYDAMVDNLGDYEAELDAAMGEGYNEGRKSGIQAQMDWLSGESGAAVEEANRAIGAWQAELENQKEQYIRDAMDAMMASDEYQTAKAAGDAAEMGRLIMQAKVQGMNEYNASEGAQEALEAEKTLVENIRTDAAANQDYWDAGYERSQWFTKGLVAGLYEGGIDPALGDWSYNASLGTGSASPTSVQNPSKRAVGIDYVPYDNFPALLHQGERVQTAVEARSERESRPIVISGNNITVREEADISRIAAELLAQIELAESRG